MSDKIKCPHCGEETSTVYTHCEKCNQPLSKNASGSGVFKFLTVVLIVAGVVASLAMLDTMGIASIIYFCAAAISASFMYGIGRIIDLLFQININIKMKK